MPVMLPWTVPLIFLPMFVPPWLGVKAGEMVLKVPVSETVPV